MLLCFCLLVWLAAGGQAADCAPSPVAITIGNVTLASGNIARGMEVSIGTPPQPFAFMPQWPMNNSLVFGTNGYCTDRTTAQCETIRGGKYDASASTTQKTAAQNAYPADSSPWSAASFVSDTLVLNTAENNSSSVNTFPLGVPLIDFDKEDYHPMNAIGLGFNSTLLNTLKASGQIASRSWSMFWGRNGALSSGQMEGVFVLGGYDAAKVQSEKHTQSLADAGTACSTRMVTSIADMILHFPNGTNASLFSGTASTALQVCIVPDFPALITIPYDSYFEKFQDLTSQTVTAHSFGLMYFSNRYDAKATPYAGDLTVKFQSGLSVRVPNDQLVFPNREVDENGVIQANSSGLDTAFLSLQDVNANDMSILGRQFLSAAHVLLNQDANEFSLWAANPTTDRQLVAVDETGADVTTFCSTASAGVGSSSPSSTSTGTSSHGLSAGAVAGIAVAIVIAVLAAVGGGVWLFCQRRRRAQAVPAGQLAEADGFLPSSPAGYPTGYPNAYLVAGVLDTVAAKEQTAAAAAEMAANGPREPENPSRPVHRFELQS